MSITTPTKAPFGVGLLKGLGVTLKHLFKKPATVQYPHVKPDLPPRTRGVIALFDENCTVCMLCARECPDWCIYIDSHKETLPAQKEGGRERTRNALDRFAIDFALCMYCGICVDVCPFDALFWSPEFEYAEYDIDGLLHEKERLREWADTVPPPPPLDDGADAPAEVADAIAAKNKELDAARAQADQATEEPEATAEAPKAKAQPKGGGGTNVADVHVEGAGEQIDQAVYDEQIAAGKSERMARAKAKAAWVRAQKKAKMAEQEAAAGGDGGDEPAADAGAGADAPAQAPKKALADVHVEGAGELDQEVYDQLIADGKSERMARSKAKAAWVRAQKQKQLDDDEGPEAEADGAGETEQGGDSAESEQEGGDA